MPTITVKLLAPDMKTPMETTYIYGSRVNKVGGLELSNTSGSISTFGVDFKSVYWEQVNNYAANDADSKRNTQLGMGGPDNQGMAAFPGRATEDVVAAPNVL